MKQKPMPSEFTVRQITNDDWPDVVDCWYGYEKGTSENVTLATGLLNSPGVYACWGLWKKSQLVAVTWVSCQCSNYAHVLPIRSIYRSDSLFHVEAITSLWLQVTTHYQKSGVVHFQALIADELHAEQISLQQIGFLPLAKIIRMNLHKTDMHITFAQEDLRLIQVSTTERETFIEVLERCFHDSLDVPELNVLNSAAGLTQQYDPPQVFTFFVKVRDESLGVIAVEIEQSTAVLKYLGIIPESRKKGCATKALRQLINLLFNEKTDQLSSFTPLKAYKDIQTIELRVDSRNTPARKLYQDAGFTETETETMLLYPPLTSPKQQ